MRRRRKPKRRKATAPRQAQNLSALPCSPKQMFIGNNPAAGLIMQMRRRIHAEVQLGAMKKQGVDIHAVQGEGEEKKEAVAEEAE